MFKPPELSASRTTWNRITFRILIPLVLMLVVLQATFAFSVWRIQQKQLSAATELSTREVERLLHAEESQKIAFLKSILEAVMNDEQMGEAFQRHDRAALLERAGPLFASLKSGHAITQFYFYLPDRTVLLRMHDPGVSGDRIDRKTLLAAERTGRASAGIEFGLNGVYTLRVVSPWRQAGKLLGYLEMGVVFESITRDIHNQLDEDVDFVVVVDKKHLDRQQWAEAAKRAGRADDWNRFPNMVLIVNTTETLSQLAVDYLLATNWTKSSWQEGNSRAVLLPLTDFNGEAPGQLIVIQDVAEQVAATGRSLRFVLMFNIIVGAVVLGFFYYFLVGVEKDLLDRTMELRRKTAFLEAQVNSSMDGILMVDNNGSVAIENRRFVDLLKIPPHVAQEKTSENPIHWVADMAQHPEQFHKRVTYLHDHPDEASHDEIELKNGMVLEQYTAAVVGEDGKRHGRIWNLRDITWRKEAQEALRASKRILEGIINAIPARIFWKDENLVYLGCNSVFARDAGFADPKDIIGKDDYQMGWRDQAELYRKDDYQVIESGNSRLLTEEPQTTPEGNTITLLTSKVPLRNSSGEICGIIGMYMDITPRKRAEEALLETESRLAHAMNMAQLVAWEYDVDRGLFTFSDRYYVFQGTTAELEGGYQMSARDFARKYVVPEDAHLVADEIANAVATTDPNYQKVIESRILRRDGTIRYVLVNISITKDAAGRTIQIHGANQDITERKQLETRVLQSQKMETVGKLAGGVAHEFNSILTAIIGQSELLLEDLPAGSPLMKNATEICEAARRAASVTQQLLAYGRKQMLRPEILDLNRVIADISRMLHHFLGKDVDVHIVPAADLHAVEVDAGQIEQVIMNLAINARDAMPTGGKLTLETANVSFDPETVGRYPELKPGDYAMLAITDTGTGMSAETKKHLFEPFFSTKDVGQGTGLGLSTCYGIIKQSGGHISVYSEPGRGTIFKIYLPQVGQKPNNRLPRLDSDLPRGTETILLVEDDRALREMATTLLIRLGYKVLAAADGIEALRLKLQHGGGHIDLLFTDVVMPHMTGKELADRLKMSSPDTRVLYTSAFTSNAIVHQGVLDKGVALLQKPFTPSALAQKLREVLNGPADLKA